MAKDAPAPAPAPAVPTGDTAPAAPAVPTGDTAPAAPAAKGTALEPVPTGDLAPTVPTGDLAPTVPGKDYFTNTPTDWREQLAGEDESRLNQLSRISNIPALIDNYFEAQSLISRGEVSNGLPDKPTKQQLATWREANGVPKTAKGYEVSLDDGLVLGTVDTRIMDVVFPVAHKFNVSTAAMTGLMNAWLKGREVEADALMSQDGIDQQSAVRQLKETWGGEYDLNINMTRNLINQLPESVRDSFANGQLAGGRAIMNSPEMMVFFADLARKLNPMGTVVPNANNPVQTMNDEITALEKRMGDDDWHKDTTAQARYQALLNARDALGGG